MHKRLTDSTESDEDTSSVNSQLINYFLPANNDNTPFLSLVDIQWRFIDSSSLDSENSNGEELKKKPKFTLFSCL